MRNIFKIVRLAKPFHKLLWMLSGLIFISSILQIAGPVIFKQVIDQLELQITEGTGDIVLSYMFLGLMFVVGLLGVVLNSISFRFGDYTAGRIGRYLTEKFYRKIFTIPQRYFDTQISGKIVNQLSRGIISLQDFLGAMSNFVVPALVQTVFTLAVLAYYNLLVATLAFLAFPIFILISHYSTKRWGEYQVKKNKIEDITRGRIQEVISNIKLVRSFNNQNSEYTFISKQLGKSVEIYDKQSRTYHVLNFVRNAGLEIAIIVVMVIVFQQTFDGNMSFGELVLIIQLLNQLRRPLFAMSFILERIKQAETGSKEYFEILELNVSEEFPNVRPSTVLENPKLTFDNVSFEYDKDSIVLDKVSFSAKSGETIALVGHSGAGKTTITNLILKFYNPTDGTISLNNKSYKALSHQDVRANISLVFQDSELFSTTIKDNVSYGKSKATEKQVIAALKKANAYDFVKKFKKGINQEIGERGTRLSGGQKQRIQIARAILHNAPILILDEATSSLDAKSERLVQDALENLMKNKLVLIIAHRFSTIQDADSIIVIDDGKIVDSGDPHALARRKGVYSELLQYQIEGNKKLLEKYELR